MSKKKFLFYFNTPGWGGNEIMALSIMKEVVRCEKIVEIICSAEQKQKFIKMDNFDKISFLNDKVINYEEYEKIIIILPSFLSSLKMISEYNLFFNDKVYLYAPFWGWEWSKKNSVIFRKYFLSVFLFFTKIKILAIRHDFEKNIIRDSENRVLIIPNYATKEFHCYESNEKNLYCIGRVDFSQKGQDELLKALIKLKQKKFNFFDKLIFIGDGPDLKKLMKLSESYEWVEFSPWISSGEIRISNKSICILASHYEGLPLTALEAIMSNIPVIATRNSALNSILPRECLHQNDSISLENAINYTFSNYSKILVCCKSKVTKGYTYSSFSESIKKFCRD